MPAERTRCISVRLPESLYERVALRAAQHATTVADYVRVLLDEATARGLPTAGSAPLPLPEEGMLRLAHALLFTEASLEAFLAERVGLADEIREKAAHKLSELLDKSPPSFGGMP